MIEIPLPHSTLQTNFILLVILNIEVAKRVFARGFYSVRVYEMPSSLLLFVSQILRQEQSRIQQVLNSLPHRLAAIPGGVAMAAAFVIYLGPYHYNFRRLMLTVHWPNCLRERGVPLVIDSIDSTRGKIRGT